MTTTQTTSTERPTCEATHDGNGDRVTSKTPRKQIKTCGADSVVRQRIQYDDGSHTDWIEHCARHELPGTYIFTGTLQNQRRDTLPLVEPAMAACEHCRTAFTPKATGRPPRFCSTRCRVAAHRAAKTTTPDDPERDELATRMPWLDLCTATDPANWKCVRPAAHDVGPHMSSPGTRWT